MTIVIFGILTTVLIVLAILLYSTRNKVSQLNQTLQILRQAKAMDEREIAQLKEKFNGLDEQHLKLIQAYQALETTANKLEQENKILRGQQ